MREKIRKFAEDLELYSRMTDIASVSRRYFVIGFFDGVLTILGLLIGAQLAGHAHARLVISAGVATGLALGISSGWGAFEAERIEQKILKDEKERALLIHGRECAVDRAHRFAMYISSLVHAVAPMIAALLPLIPYTLLPEDEAFYAAIGIGLISLFAVGATLGRMAKFNAVVSGLRMLLAGVLTMVVVSVLNPSHLT